MYKEIVFPDINIKYSENADDDIDIEVYEEEDWNILFILS